MPILLFPHGASGAGPVMPGQVGVEHWFPLSDASSGAEGDIPLGNAFAGALPYLFGPTGPGMPDVDDLDDFLGANGEITQSINQASGNLLVRVTLPSSGGLTESVILTYNLQDANDVGVGPGWRIEPSLESSPSCVTLTAASGSQRPYAVRTDGSLLAPPGIFDSLAADGDSWVETRRNNKQRFYNPDGSLGSVVDRNSNAWTYARDGSGALLQIQHPDGRQTVFSYPSDAGGRLGIISDPAGRLTTLAYDSRSRLQSIVRPDSSVITLAYWGASSWMNALQDPDGFVTTYALGSAGGYPVISGVQDPEGGIRALSYVNNCVAGDALGYPWNSAIDSLGRLSAFTDPQGRQMQIGWSGNHQVTQAQGPLDRTATYAYNAQGRLTGTTDPLGHASAWSYSADGKWLQSVTDPTGATAECAYDPDTQDRLVTIDGDGRRVTYAYTVQGQVMSRARSIDGKLNTLLYDYYGFGESSPPFTLKQTGLSLGPASYGWATLTHDAAGNVSQSVDADGKTMSYLHSPMDRLLAQIDGAGRCTTHGYDLRDNPIVTVDPLGHRRSLVYDGNSRLRAEIDPLGFRTTQGYDLVGNHTLTLDAENAVWKDSPSPRRDRIASAAPVSGTTSYAHDGAGRLLYVTDPSNRITSHGYDLSDRLTQRIDYPAPGTPEVTGMQYTNRDELMAHTDPNGVATTLGYYDSGLFKQHTVSGQSGPAVESHTYAGATDAKSYTDALGGVTSYGYDESGRRVATQDALGFITTSVYSPAGDLLATINPRGAIVTLGYDESHRRVSRTVSPRPGLLRTWTTVYDNAGRVISEVAPDGVSHGYGYFDNNWIQAEIDALGGRTSYTYNNRGQVRTVTDAEGRVTTHVYDGEGRQTGIIDPAGFVTTTLYDNSGNPNVAIDPLGSRTTHLYDGANRPWVTQASPRPGFLYVTTTIYDGAGRVTMVYNADATTVGYDYQYPLADGATLRWDELGHTWIQVRDKARNILSDIDPNGNRMAENHYDALQRLSYTQKQRAYTLGSSYATRSLVYDAVGNTTAVIDGLGRRSTTMYDFLNRVTTRVRQAGPGVLLTESQDYDARGNLLYTLDARGYQTDYGYDANNRLVMVQDPLGGITTTVYDRTGRRIAVQHPTTDAGPAYTTFAYDPRGLLTTLVHADGSIEQFGYDAAGRQKTHILASGKIVTYLYDGLGRQTLLIPPGSQPPVAQGWDSRSRRTSMVDGTGRTVYLYYDDGREKAVQRAEGILTYTYDMGGRRTAMSYAPGTVWYGYDPDNNLATLTSAWGEVTRYAWDLAEELTSITIANGSIVSLLYDGAGRLVYKGDPDPTEGIGYSYGLDENGNRVTITENDGSQTVNQYDDKNRLLQETRVGTSAYDCGYAYDLNGSMMARDLPGGGRVTFTLDNAAKITGDSLANNYVYDLDGRMTSRQGVLGTLAWDYDYAGRVVTMLLDGPTTLTYRYDGDGRLQRLYRNGARTWFLLDGRDVLREAVATIAVSGGGIGLKLRPSEMPLLGNLTFPAISVAPQEIIEYTHGVGLISQRVTQTSYFRWDGRSTGRRMEDASGDDSSDAIYDAYGLLRSPTTLASAYGFVGEEGVRGEKEIPNAPYHMRARMYDPLLGRFVSRDPVWDSNLYEYAKGNPWSNIDPEGMQARSAGDVFNELWSHISTAYPHLTSAQRQRVKDLLREIIHKHDGRWEDMSYGPAAELWNSILLPEYHKYVLQERGMTPWHAPENAWPQEIQQQLEASGVLTSNPMWGVLQQDIRSLTSHRNEYPHSDRYGWFQDVQWQACHGNPAARKLMEDWAAAMGASGRRARPVPPITHLVPPRPGPSGVSAQPKPPTIGTAPNGQVPPGTEIKYGPNVPGWVRVIGDGLVVIIVGAAMAYGGYSGYAALTGPLAESAFSALLYTKGKVLTEAIAKVLPSGVVMQLTHRGRTLVKIQSAFREPSVKGFNIISIEWLEVENKKPSEPKWTWKFRIDWHELPVDNENIPAEHRGKPRLHHHLQTKEPGSHKIHRPYEIKK